jgi:two-component system, OmpR family, response regulator MprA
VPTVLVAGLRPSPAPALQRAGLAVRPAPDGLTALDALAADPPDAVALAADLPDLDGVEVIRQARAERRTVPICLVTRGRPEAALAAGADDVVRLPASPAELAVRLSALARANRPDTGTLTVADIAVDPAAGAGRRGRDLHLTGRELSLLTVLMRHAGQVVDRRTVLAEVWGYPPALDGEVPDLVLAGLRRKLGRPEIVGTAPGGIVLRV